jgi:WD40 repeat protein
MGLTEACIGLDFERMPAHDRPVCGIRASDPVPGGGARARTPRTRTIDRAPLSHVGVTGSKMRFAAFISYSHAADAQVAAAIQAGLQQFAKPWLKRRALNVFRDQTNLAASPGLWPSIERALQESEWFVLIASPESAGSAWVRQEIDWWLTHRSVERLIIAVTGGELAWDASKGGFDAATSSALPPNLLGRFPSEPLYVDLRWARGHADLRIKSERFRAAILDIATPLHGKDKDDIDAEDLRAHRRSRRLAFGGVAALAGLTAGLAVIAYLAIGQRNLAEARLDAALAGRLAAQAGASQDREPSLVERNTLLAVEAMRRRPSFEAAMAMRAGMSLLPVPVGRVRHARAPSALALSGDGSLLAVAAESGASPPGWIVLVIDTKSGAEIVRLPVAAETAGLALGSNGKKLAILSRAAPRDVAIWDLEKKRLERRLPPEGPVIAMALSSDGQYLATGDEFGRAVVWEVASGQSRGSIRHQSPVHQIAFESVPGQVVSGERDGTLRIWNVATGRDVGRVGLQARFEPPAVMAPDGSRIALVSDKDRIQVRSVDVSTAAAVETIRHELTSSHVPTLSLSKTRIATAGKDKTVRIWVLGTGEEEIRAPFDSQVVTVALSGDSSTLAVGAYAGGMSIESLPYLDARRTEGIWAVNAWDLDRPPSSMNSGTWVFRIHREDGSRFRHERPVVAVGLSAKGEMLVTASGRSPTETAVIRESPRPRSTAPIQSHLRIWEVRSGRELANEVLAGVTTSAGIAPDQSAVAAIADDGTLRVWALPRELVRTAEARALGKPRLVLDTGSRNGGIVFSADSSRIGIVGTGGGVFDLTSGTAMFRAGPEQTSVGFDAAMTRVLVEGKSPDRMSLRSRLLEVGSERVLHQADALHGNGRALASDGRWAAAVNRTDGGGSATGQFGIHVSDLAKATRMSTGVGHNQEITAMTFSPDGSHLATASRDGTARIWDTSVGAEAARFGDGGIVNAVAFSADGRLFAVGTEAGNAAVYLWQPADLIAQACARLTRNLTKLEWRQFMGEVEYRATCNDLPLDQRPR